MPCFFVRLFLFLILSAVLASCKDGQTIPPELPSAKTKPTHSKKQPPKSAPSAASKKYLREKKIAIAELEKKERALRIAGIRLNARINRVIETTKGKRGEKPISEAWVENSQGNSSNVLVQRLQIELLEAFLKAAETRIQFFSPKEKQTNEAKLLGTRTELARAELVKVISIQFLTKINRMQVRLSKEFGITLLDLTPSLTKKQAKNLPPFLKKTSGRPTFSRASVISITQFKADFDESKWQEAKHQVEALIAEIQRFLNNKHLSFKGGRSSYSKRAAQAAHNVVQYAKGSALLPPMTVVLDALSDSQGKDALVQQISEKSLKLLLDRYNRILSEMAQVGTQFSPEGEVQVLPEKDYLQEFRKKRKILMLLFAHEEYHKGMIPYYHALFRCIFTGINISKQLDPDLNEDWIRRFRIMSKASKRTFQRADVDENKNPFYNLEKRLRANPNAPPGRAA